MMKQKNELKKTKLVTTTQAAKLLIPNVTRDRVRYMCEKQNKFPNVQKIGNTWLIPISDIESENKRRAKNPYIK